MKWKVLCVCVCVCVCVCTDKAAIRVERSELNGNLSTQHMHCDAALAHVQFLGGVLSFTIFILFAQYVRLLPYYNKHDSV